MDRREPPRERSPHYERRSSGRDDRRETRRRDSRSRSPMHKRPRTSRREEHASHHHSSRHRSHRHHAEKSRKKDDGPIKDLPYSARALSKADLSSFEPLFAEYLSLQKQKDIEDMDDREVRGRWKSFMGKWNRGELAEGWYDPETFSRIKESDPGRTRRAENASGRHGDAEKEDITAENEGDEDEDEDDYGPVLPTGTLSSGRRSGPGIPTLQDLSLRGEQQEEDREASLTALRTARKADRSLQKERLDDLTPRADAGTRERKLEKKQLLNEKLQSFREKSPGMEAPEKELMGGDDSLEEYKRMKEKEQRKKSEREVRREEIARAKTEEMEERRRAWREREEGTVGMLRELARQRFG